MVHAERRQQIEERAQDRCNDCNNRICEAIIEREVNSRALESDRLKAADKLRQNIELAKGLLEQSAQSVMRRAQTEQQLMDEALKAEREIEMQCEKVTQMVRDGQAQNLYSLHPNKWLLENHHKFV